MQGDIKSHNLTAIVGQDHYYIPQSKRSGSNDKHVDGGNTLGLIEQEASPGQGGPTASSHHILGDRSLADLDAELEEFRRESEMRSERVGAAHLTN